MSRDDSNPGAILQPLDFKPQCEWLRIPADRNSRCENPAEWYAKCPTCDPRTATPSVRLSCVGHKAEAAAVDGYLTFGCHLGPSWAVRFHQLQGGVVV